MYDIIKSQFQSGKALAQSKYFGSIKRELFPKFHWDLYPMANDYYHELNPFFIYNLYREDFFRFAKVLTVRDGYVTFASFIMNNFSTFSKLETQKFLIHEDLAPLVPPNLQSYFGCWKIVQKNQTTLEKAKKVIVFGFISEQYLGNLDQLAERMKPLKGISKEATVELYVPIRKNVFEKESKESYVIHHVMNHIKDILPDRKLKILSSENFFDITDFKNTYVFDLAEDKFMVSDNYLHYYVQARGATVNNNSLTEAPEDSIFSLDLSLHHEFHVTPLPKVNNVFTDLLFYKKQNPNVKDFNFDPVFQNLLRKLLAP